MIDVFPETLTSQGYIQHHLTNLTLGCFPSKGSWPSPAMPRKQAEMGFWAINVDTMFFSILLGWLFLWFFGGSPRTSPRGAGAAQNFVEWIVDFVEENVRGSFSGKNPWSRRWP